MRNLFDQYSQPENRLTHALAVSLNEDRALLKSFLSLLGIRQPLPARELGIVEQGLPGEHSKTEEEAERRGLPDIVIHDDEKWCVLVESKVEAGLTADQLRRHERTLTRRGFTTVNVLALTKDGVLVPPGAIALTWSDLYEWLGKAANRREWPDRLRAYLRAAEVRLAREGYLSEGTLTMFDGFPFSADTPYTYGEGKRLLDLALLELRKNKSLLKLGMDPGAKGRPAITGRGEGGVWDFLQLRDRPKRGLHTRHPHLTLGVHTDRVSVALTLPNSMNPVLRGHLAALTPEQLGQLHGEILRRAKPLIKLKAVVEASAVQRHYLSQRSTPINDGKVQFSLQTSLDRRSGAAKLQPEWAALFSSLLKRKRSNIQFQYVINIPWGAKGLDTRAALGMIAGAWSALGPVLGVLRGK